MNDFKKGQEVFHVGTNFDYYVIENNLTPDNLTTITDIDGNSYEKNINGWKFIPSGGFELYDKILAKDGEETVNVLYNSSLYETRQDYMSLTSSTEYKYPCVYTITQRDGVKYYYSSKKHPETEKKDMFVPKVIWSNGLGTYPIIDSKGDYGLTQFSYAIIDNVSNLKNIETALNNPKFIKLMEYVKFQNNKYNYKVISLLKKDFWKTFLDNIEDKQSLKQKEEIVTIDTKHEDMHISAPVVEISEIQTPSPVLKKKRSFKKRPKLILLETSYPVKNMDDVVQVEQKTGKKVNNLTKRSLNDTPTSGKKLEKNRTLKRGGKSKKTTRKCIKMH